MPPIRRTAAITALATISACSPPPSTTASLAPTNATTLLARLGADTVAMEQVTRTADRMDGVLVTRLPFAAISRYSVELASDLSPRAAEYSVRRADGSAMPGAIQSLSLRFHGDSVTITGHRATGDTTRTNLARGMASPYVNSSYALYGLAIARLLASGRDSANAAIVPFNFSVANTSTLPMRRLGGDSVRITYFGAPLYAQHDGRGNVLWFDGRATTVKHRVDRVAATDLEAVARAWAARERIAGIAGPVSPRDTARATLGRANVWVDYSRPSLRGRAVWVNGVLGDTIWRTGANNATQLSTDVPLLLGGQNLPAGIYSLWTWTTRDGYRLIVNRQHGQWGTEFRPDSNLVIVPLREGVAPTPVERFTIAIQPASPGAAQGQLVLSWGDKTLSTSIEPK